MAAAAGGKGRHMSAFDAGEYAAFLALVEQHKAIAAAKRYQPAIIAPFGRRVLDHTTDLSKAERNTIVRYRGKERTINQWADSVGMHRQTFCNRLGMGWSLAKALRTPVANTGNGGRKGLG